MKGKVLSHSVVQIFTEFTESISIFSQRTYDCLNPLDKVSLYVWAAVCLVDFLSVCFGLLFTSYWQFILPLKFIHFQFMIS